METKYTKESLENLRIHELRDLARKVQIKSPTTLKKEDIIEQILDVVSGNQEPYVKKTNKGRPPRFTKDLLDFLVPQQLYNSGDKPIYAPIDSRFDMYINAPDVEFNAQDKGVQCGYVDILPAGYGILRVNGFGPSDKDVFVPKQLVQKEHLCAGFKVKGEVKQIKADKPLALTKVLESDHIDVKFDDIPFAKSKSQLKLQNKLLNNLKIAKGSRQLIMLHGKQDLFDVGFDICYDLAGSKCDVIYVNINALPEQNINATNFTIANIPFTEIEVNQISAVNLVINRAKVLMAQGKDVVVVFKGVYSVLRSMSIACNGNINLKDIAVEALHKFKQMVAAAKSADKGSLSIIMIDNISNVPESLRELIKYELLPYFTVTEIK